MYDERNMKAWRFIASLVTVILMVVTLALQILTVKPLLLVLLCSGVLLLITISLVFDGILKDSKNLFTHGAWYAIWLFVMIINLCKV